MFGKRKRLERQVEALEMELLGAYTDLIKAQHEIRKLDKAGNELYIAYKALQKKQSHEQFSQDEIRSLLMLVHPDKHDGKESAKLMTQKLLRMRK